MATARAKLVEVSKGVVPEPAARVERLGEIGLANYPPYLMNRIMGRYNANLRDEMAALGLTTPKMRALAILSVIDGIQISELMVYAVVEQSTLSRALDQLTSDGLIRRDTDPNDSRATHLYLTAQGRATFEHLWPSMAQQYRDMFDGISDDERGAFVATLHKMLSNVKRSDL